MRTIIAWCLALLCAGCTTTPALAPLPASHPASPLAAEAPLPPASRALAGEPGAGEHKGHDVHPEHHDVHHEMHGEHE